MKARRGGKGESEARRPRAERGGGDWVVGRAALGEGRQWASLPLGRNRMCCGILGAGNYPTEGKSMDRRIRGWIGG